MKKFYCVLVLLLLIMFSGMSYFSDGKWELGLSSVPSSFSASDGLFRITYKKWELRYETAQRLREKEEFYNKTEEQLLQDKDGEDEVDRRGAALEATCK